MPKISPSMKAWLSGVWGLFTDDVLWILAALRTMNIPEKNGGHI